MKDYKAIFDKVETALIRSGSKNLPVDEIQNKLERFKHFENKTYSDSEYFQIIVDVIFFSGFRAATVGKKLLTIHKYFQDYETVAAYPDNKVDEISNDPTMLRNRNKIQACIDNAKVFKNIITEYGSFRAYIDSFSPTTAFENLMLLKEDLQYRFKGLGNITTYHVLTDIGLPVLKPDRVICRIFQRLGLIENDGQLLKTIIQGRKFAQATGYPIRYIDIVFVSYGQVKAEEFGLDKGICLEDDPRCSICGVIDYCNYLRQNHTKNLSDT